MYKEPTSKKDIWNPHFHNEFLGFEDIAFIWRRFQTLFSDWPSIEGYQYMADTLGFNSSHAQSLTFIQDSAEIQYEKRIYGWHQIPTRLQCWHDFFNNLTWLCWPKLKRAIIEKSIGSPKLSTARTALQNTLAHFDECGVILVSTEESHFKSLQNFEWQQFFQAPEITTQVKPVLIGHGILEKCLNPYIGVTAKGVFLKAPQGFFELTLEAQHQYIDNEMAEYIQSDDFPTNPRHLQPFPFLGWPHWYDKQDDTFYNNTAYFRQPRNIEPLSVGLIAYEGKTL